MPVKQIDVTAKQQKFIAEEVKAGRYRDESEVLLAGLDLLLKERRQTETLKKMIQVGIDDADAGRGVVLKSRADLKSYGDRILKKALKTKVSK